MMIASYPIMYPIRMFNDLLLQKLHSLMYYYCMPGTVLSTRNKLVMKTDTAPALKSNKLVMKTDTVPALTV